MPFELETLALIGAGLLLAGIVKGATGLGYASCALPFLVYTVGLKEAIVLVLAPAMATNVAVALGTDHLVETCRTFSRLYLAMLPGIAVGIFLLIWIDAGLAIMLLGTSIVTYTLFALAHPKFALPPSLIGPLQIPVGFVNGILTGLTGSQVMPLIPFIMATSLAPNQVVQAINLGVMLASIVLVIGLLITGITTKTLFLLSILATVPALLGVEFGRRLRAQIPTRYFKTTVLVVLLLSGVGMILR